MLPAHQPNGVNQYVCCCRSGVAQHLRYEHAQSSNSELDESDFIPGTSSSAGRVIDEVRVKTEMGFGVSLEQFHRTHLEYQQKPSMDLVDPMMLGVHTHGMLGLLAAEMGDDETKTGLLAHADHAMNPTWKEGGLYYPRCDDLNTESYVTCVTGNALIGATRLVTKNGLSDLLNRPWGTKELESPIISGIPYPDALVSRAIYVPGGIQFDVVPSGIDAISFEYRVSGLAPSSRIAVTTNSESGEETQEVHSDPSGDLTLNARLDGKLSIRVEAVA